MLARLALCFLLSVMGATQTIAQDTPVVSQTPVVVVAEPVEAVPVVVTKLSLPSADGSQTREYDVVDFSVSVARGLSYGVGDPRGEVSATLSLAGGLDDLLLQWASQGAIDTEQARDLTVRSDKPDAPRVYEMRGARVLGLNISGGSVSMISLQVGLTSLTIDGVRMN